MKRIIAILVLLCASPAYAGDWTLEQLQLEGIYLAAHAIDYAQTRYAMANPDRFVETNPLLGSKPTQGSLNKLFISTALAHVASVHFSGKNRNTLLKLSVGAKASIIGWNAYIGAGVKF